MNEIQRLPADIALPSLPEDIQRELRIIAFRKSNGPPGIPNACPHAASILSAYRAQIKPTTLALVRQWLEDLAVGVPVPKSQQDIGMAPRAATVFAACGEFPSACWTQKTLVMALRAFEWFPSPAKVYELLKPVADEIAATLAGLEAIANAKPTEIARERTEPYILPPPPSWVHDRTIRGARGQPELRAQPPVRTVEEQIAILKAG